MKKNWLKNVLIFLVIVNLVMLVSYAFAFYFNNKEFISTDDFNTLNLSVDDTVNLASPDLTGKEYLGNGVYRIVDSETVTFDYNVFSGVWTFNTKIPIASFNEYFLGNDEMSINQNYNFKTTYLTPDDNVAVGWRNTGTPNASILNEGLINASIFSDRGFRILSIKTHGLINVTNYQFKLQIEQGSTATPYQVPKEPQLFYENMIYNNGYDHGHNEGYIEGYIEGFNEGLDQVFNPNNLMTVAEKKGRGTTGPSTEYFGFTIPLNIKVDRVTILNLDGYSLKPLTWSGGANIYQGILFNYQGGSSSYSFKNVYDEYEQLMEILVDESKILTSITLVLAINNPSMPAPDFENMQNHMLNNLGVYINNKVITDNAIDKFKGIIEADVRDSLDDEYQQKYDALYTYKLSQQYQLGYDEGLKEKDAYGFSALLKSIFIGLGSFLAIPLLPKITIGAILSVPLVFGIIFFIIGKRKGD